MEIFYYKIAWTVALCVSLCILLFISFRSWGVISWAFLLRKELRDIKGLTGNGETPREKAFAVVESKCRSIINAYSPEIENYSDLHGYISEIAGCYYPDSEKPELNVTIGHLLYSLDKSVQRFDLILSRKGMRSIAKINIRQVKSIYNNYKSIVEKPYVKFYLNHRKRIQNISYIRYIVFPDPFSILFFLSRNLMILLLTKYLMVDLYLFAGMLAVDVYDERIETRVDQAGQELDIEETLEELNSLNIENSAAMPYKIGEIRNGFLGFSAVLKNDPGFKQWKQAVIDAANAIASKYFPDKPNPLEEAVIGPLVLKTGDWIQIIARGEGVPVAGRLYNTRLGTLYQAKRLTDFKLPSSVEKVIINAQKTYGWVKWPLRVYRLLKKFSLWRIALEVGWATGRKAALVYLYGRTFDKTVEELDDVYKMSRDLEKWLPYFNKV